MAFYDVKGAPFRYRGAVNVEDCETSEEVMKAANLNWEVAKCEIVAKMPALAPDGLAGEGFIHGSDYYSEVPNAFATYRTDCNIPLGIVKERYTPVQNIEAFKFFDGAIGKDKAIWQTAGFFGNGERIFVSAKLPKNIFVKGDPVDNYLVFTTSHDGTSGVKILFTPIRVVCQNTLNAAIKGSTNYVSFRHTSSVHSNLDIAAEILGICEQRRVYLEHQFEALSKIKIKDSNAQDVFASVILTENEFDALSATGHTVQQLIDRNYMAMQDANISTKKMNALGFMNDYYFNGPGQKEILGTGWGVYNAVTGYYSNVDNSIGTKRMDSLLFGDKSRKIQQAGDTILANEDFYMKEFSVQAGI